MPKSLNFQENHSQITYVYVHTLHEAKYIKTFTFREFNYIITLVKN